MINIDGFVDFPMQTGEHRELTITGDGPFIVTNSCFVDSPPPPGFRPCAACGSISIQSGESYQFETDAKFWQGKEGTLSIEIVDSVGESKKIDIKVLADGNSTSGQMMMGQ